jgi:hypothetical protein
MIEGMKIITVNPKKMTQSSSKRKTQASQAEKARCALRPSVKI